MNPNVKPAKKNSLVMLFANAVAVSVLALIIALVVHGPDGIFEINTQMAIPFLVIAAVAGSILNTLPFRPGSGEAVNTLSEINIAEAVRTSILGAMLRQLLMAVMVVLFFAAIFVVAMAFGLGD